MMKILDDGGGAQKLFRYFAAATNFGRGGKVKDAAYCT